MAKDSTDRRRLNEARLFERAAERFSRNHRLKRVCVGPNRKGCPEHVKDPVILEVGHIGGGGTEERRRLKEFVRSHGGRVPNENHGGRVYLEMLDWAERQGYHLGVELDWQCPNCNQREIRWKTFGARQLVRRERSNVSGEEVCV